MTATAPTIIVQKKCTIADGPLVAWFYEGNERVEYVRLAVPIKSPISSGIVVAQKQIDSFLSALGDFSQVILFRHRPKFRYYWDRPGLPFSGDEGEPSSDDELSGDAGMAFTLRLQTFPVRSEEEMLTIAVRHIDGVWVPQ